MKGSRNSLTSLRVFLVAARQLNFSRAAEDLHLTQSAVSKHIQSLEERLGSALFKRTPTGLRITHAGAVYLEKISAALRLIDEAEALVARPETRVNLNIAVSPSFAQFCLIPRMREFFDLHPDVRLNIRPRLMTPRDRQEGFDAEIQLHTGHVSGMTSSYLCGREMGLVIAPSLAKAHRLRAPRISPQSRCSSAPSGAMDGMNGEQRWHRAGTAQASTLPSTRGSPCCCRQS